MKVLYIAGYGRSGSTLLDQLLGQFDSVVSTGELEKIWQYGIVDNKYCSCGQLFYDCEFWKAVVTDAYGDDYVEVAKKALELRKHIKFRDMFVFTNRKTSILKDDAYTEYLKIWGRLLNSIAKVGKSTLIVDSSKVPTFIHLMERSSEINLYVLNLVRDSRGVAFSYERKKTTREKDGLERLIKRNNFFISGMYWLIWNRFIFKSKLPKEKIMVTKYEDMVNSPADTIGRIFQFTEEKKDTLEIFKDDYVNMKVTHTIGGNPGRFNGGKIVLKSDDEWKRELPFYKKAILFAITFPLMRKYRYGWKN